MKVAHIISSLGERSGGPSRSVYLTVKGLVDNSINAQILTYQDIINDNPNISNEHFIKSVDYLRNRMFAYNPTYKALLTAEDYDLFHIHALYEYSPLAGLSVATDKNSPYIVSPRGSLYPTALKKNAIKKNLINRAYLFNKLNKAAAIQVTSVEEMDHIRALGIKAPIAIIPNPLEITESICEIAVHKKKRFGFLGRLSPIKNIETLLYAWSESGLDTRDDAELVIIGDCAEKEKSYKEFLISEQDRLGIKNIKWCGFLFGEEKEKELKSLSYLVLPSKSENFGIVVLDALINGVPVIASKGTPWRELETEQCGWWIENSVQSFAETISKAYDTPEEKWIDMANNGREMVVKNYSMEMVSKRMKLMYEWVLGKAEKPNFIFLK